MRHKDHEHCQICGAHFETHAELEQHSRLRHTQQGISGVNPSSEYPVEPPPNARSTRKNKEFTRGHDE